MVVFVFVEIPASLHSLQAKAANAEEILVSMAAAGAGVLPVGEGALLNLINGNTSVGNEVFQFLSTKMDTTDMTRPHGYLVWLAYDKNFNLVPDGSGALRVTDPNELGTLFSGEIPIAKMGYLHVYVSNGTEAKTINFDNLYITTMQGKTRQINHYYPYGLRMRMGHGQRYTQMYTTKELQTGEYWDASVSTGLEMYDFDARFYDPQLGRWFVGDPAEQFHNPYLAMGNNPVVYVDPDGEFVHLIIGAAIGGMMNLIMNADNIENPGQFFAYFGVGALAGALGAGVGAGISSGISGCSFGAGFVGVNSAEIGVASSSFLSGAAIGGGAGFSSGFATGFGNTGIQGGNIDDIFSTGLEYGWKGAATGAVLGGLGGGLKAVFDGKSFWTGKTTFNDKVDYFISQHKEELIDKYGEDVFKNTKVKGRRFFKPYGRTKGTGVSSGENFLGYPGENSKVLISRRVINDFYKSNSTNSSATIYHEFSHASDYYKGIDKFVMENFDYPENILFLENRAYQIENILFQTPFGIQNLHDYWQAYFDYLLR